MIPIAKPYFDGKEIAAVNKVLKSGMIAQGKVTHELEEKFHDICKTKFAVAINNGTAALHTALYAIGIQPGDEVITTPFTFIATVNSILMMGAKPVFVDIDPNTYNLDPTKITTAITKKTKAIIVVNLYGQPADYKSINDIAKRHGLIVVEDAAQSINSTFRKKLSGNLADIACFSLYATKNITCGEGGMITTNNKNYYEKALLFRNHGQPVNTRYVYIDLGYNYRITDIQASIALEQLKKIEVITKKRQEIAKKYDEAFHDIKGIVIPYRQPYSTHVYHQYTLRITKDFPISRDSLQSFLLEKGIQTMIYYPQPLTHFKHVKRNSKLNTHIKVTQQVSKEVISIPIHPSITNQEVKYITQTIKKI